MLFCSCLITGGLPLESVVTATWSLVCSWSERSKERESTNLNVSDNRKGRERITSAWLVDTSRVTWEHLLATVFHNWLWRVLRSSFFLGSTRIADKAMLDLEGFFISSSYLLRRSWKNSSLWRTEWFDLRRLKFLERVWTNSELRIWCKSRLANLPLTWLKYPVQGIWHPGFEWRLAMSTEYSAVLLETFQQD